MILGGLLTGQIIKTDHWKHVASTNETSFLTEKAAHQRDIINWQLAYTSAVHLAEANADRVAAEQTTISEKSQSEYEARIADARARAGRVRHDAQAPVDHGSAHDTSVSSLPAAPSGTPEAARDGLSVAQRLRATEQAIQLDELIKWVEAQHAVSVNGPKQTAPSRP